MDCRWASLTHLQIYRGNRPWEMAKWGRVRGDLQYCELSTKSLEPFANIVRLIGKGCHNDVWNRWTLTKCQNGCLTSGAICVHNHIYCTIGTAMRHRRGGVGFCADSPQPIFLVGKLPNLEPTMVVGNVRSLQRYGAQPDSLSNGGDQGANRRDNPHPSYPSSQTGLDTRALRHNGGCLRSSSISSHSHASRLESAKSEPHEHPPESTRRSLPGKTLRRATARSPTCLGRRIQAGRPPLKAR